MAHSSSRPTNQWWKKADEPHEELCSLVDWLQRNQSFQRNRIDKYNRMYLNFRTEGRNIGETGDRVGEVGLKYNVLKSCIDTANAKIGSTKPKVVFLTENGNRQKQKRGKLKSDIIKSLFLQTGIYSEMPMAHRDAMITGDGYIKIFVNRKKIMCERVFPEEILVDIDEAIHNNPSRIYQVKQLDREVVREMFPDHLVAIENSISSQVGQVSRNVDSIQVVEAWHIDRDYDADDEDSVSKGRHVIAISGGTLLDEQEWTGTQAPIVHLCWSAPVRGFYGVGLGEELMDIQREINITLQRIQQIVETMAVPRYMAPKSAKLNALQLTNGVGNVIEYQGTQPPTMETARVVHPELFEHLDRMMEKAYAITGISELSAQSKKPAGLESGVALRTFNDIQTERFALAAQGYEQAFVHAAELYADAAEAIEAEYGKFPVLVRQRNGTKKVNWAEARLDRDEYMLDAWPTSLLPSTPSGKLQTVQEMMQMGLLEKEDVLALLDYPDVDRLNYWKNAQIDFAEALVESAYDGESLTPPEAHMNLKLITSYMQNGLARAEEMNISEANKEAMRDWILQAAMLMAPAQESAAPSGPGMAPIPPNDPMTMGA